MKKIAVMCAMIIALSSCIVLPISAADEYFVNTQVAAGKLKSKSESSKSPTAKKTKDNDKASSSKDTATSKKADSTKDAASSKKADETKDIDTTTDGEEVLKSAFKSTDGSNFVVVSGANFKGGVEKQIMQQINEVRRENGLEPLIFDAALQSAARIRARELYKAGPNKFAHKRPNGDKWSTVITTDVPILFHDAGENLCMTEYNDPSITYATSADFYMEQWINSPAHYDNIVRENFTHAGVAVYVGKKNGITYGYAATIFGTPK